MLILFGAFLVEVLFGFSLIRGEQLVRMIVAVDLLNGRLQQAGLVWVSCGRVLTRQTAGQAAQAIEEL